MGADSPRPDIGDILSLQIYTQSTRFIDLTQATARKPHYHIGCAAGWNPLGHRRLPVPMPASPPAPLDFTRRTSTRPGPCQRRPSAQPQQIPSHPDSSLSQASLSAGHAEPAHDPCYGLHPNLDDQSNVQEGTTSSLLETGPGLIWTPLLQAVSSDTDDPCPVLVLAWVRPDARIKTCASSYSTWKVWALKFESMSAAVVTSSRDTQQENQ